MTSTTPPAAAPAVPEDAPFSPSQRDWLNGFLAGLTVVARAAHGDHTQSEADAPAAPLTVLYGSQSGNCEALSKDLRKFAKSRGFTPTISELDGFDRDTLPAVSHLLIITSTFGEGDPPDNAKNFCAWLASDAAPSLEGVNYAVCGLGDSSYTFFNKCAADLDARLEGLGATRIADYVACDVAYEDDYAAWKAAAFDSEAFASAAGAPAAAPAEEKGDGPRFDKNNPFPASVLHVENLSGEGSAKEVNHVEISLAGSGLAYEAGDALGVWPVNCAEHAQQIMAAMGWSGREPVTLKSGPTSLRDALISRLDICTLTPGILAALGIDRPMDDFDDRHVIDALETLGSPIDPQTLVDALRPLQPRLYSIASSPHAHPGEVHLTVGAVRYQTHGRARKGVASTFLADRCPPGAKVGVYVHRSAHFHLPDDDTPLIMIGPGTGVAPFRAFLEERAHRQAPGKTWLFFGDQHEAHDFLYRDELLAHRAANTLHRLDTAWSRDQAEKIYVQEKMRAAGAELFAWLEAGGRVYVCGDASRMAKDVDAALHQIIAEHGKRSEEDAAAYVEKMKAEHRYQRDVY